MKANNNPKNRRTLVAYQKRQLKLAKETEKKARQRRIKTNLENWIESLSPALKRARPSNLPKETVEDLRLAPFTEPFDKYMIITAKDSTNATFAAYALIYALLRGGHVTPSEIKKTSLIDGYRNISGYYGARKWKEYFFEDDSKVLLIEGASKYLTRLGSTGEEAFWREFIELTRKNEKLVIITYSADEKESKNKTFVPTLTSEPEINSRLVTKSIYAFIKEKEEEEIRNEQAKAYKSL